ncbi:MAG: rhomboid family intramembrane serine protease [Bryobacteraceae bacterium]
MCPNCRAFITTDDRVCPYCGIKLGAKAVDRRSPSDLAGGLIPANRFTTTMILLINIALYAACNLFSMRHFGSGFLNIDGQTLLAFGAKDRFLILVGGEYWRLITAGFLHGGIFHILMNSWALTYVGAQVEELYGSSRYIVIYFVATVLGFAASVFWSPAISVGASAGLFGLIGAMIALSLGSDSSMARAVRGHYVQWAIYGIVLGLLPGFHIDNAAHIGGLAGGFGVAYIAGTPLLVEHLRDKMIRVAAGFCLLLTALAFAILILRFALAAA